MEKSNVEFAGKVLVLAEVWTPCSISGLPVDNTYFKPCEPQLPDGPEIKFDGQNNSIRKLIIYYKLPNTKMQVAVTTNKWYH